MIKLGGSVSPDVIRLSAGIPDTRDVFHVPSRFLVIVPKLIPFAKSGRDAPIGVVSRMACNWAVI